MECPFPPSKLTLPMGDLDLQIIHGFLGPPESSTPTASRSVQPFLQDDRQTDRPHYSLVTIGRIYVLSTAMRPDTKKKKEECILKIFVSVVKMDIRC